MKFIPQPLKPSPVSDELFKDLKQWAKTTEFSSPLPWGSVESKILSTPMPPKAELVSSDYIKREKATGIFLLAVYAFRLSIPYAGVGILAYLIFQDTKFFNNIWSTVLFVIGLLAFGNQLALASMSLSTRRRSSSSVVYALSTLVATTASYALLFSLVIYPGDSLALSSPKLWMLLASGAGLANIIIMFFMVKPSLAVPKTPTKRMTPEEYHYRGMRAGVLEVFVKRGFVNQSDVSEIMEMPLNTWKQLEAPKYGHYFK